MSGPPSSWPVIPGYDIDDVIGRGGFGTVYRAVQRSVDRTVALKVLAAVEVDDAVQRRFRAESRTIGSLSWHPHVVSLFDAGVTPAGELYLVMELVPGGSLGARLRQGEVVPPATVLEIGRQIAHALQSAHEAGVLHRDVKPDNILVDRLGRFVLSDFGIATLDDGTRSTTGNFTGTYAYSAPELLKGERATPRSDLYSLGATLHALLVGRPPFAVATDATPAAQLVRIVTEPTPPLPSWVPDELAQVIGQLMDKDAEARPPSAEALRTALDAIGPLPDAGAPVGDPGAPAADPAAPTASNAADPTAAGVPLLLPSASNDTDTEAIVDADTDAVIDPDAVTEPDGVLDAPTVLRTPTAPADPPTASPTPTAGAPLPPSDASRVAAQPGGRRRWVAVAAVAAVVVAGVVGAIVASGGGDDGSGAERASTTTSAADAPDDEADGPDATTTAPATTTTRIAAGGGEDALVVEQPDQPWSTDLSACSLLVEGLDAMGVSVGNPTGTEARCTTPYDAPDGSGTATLEMGAAGSPDGITSDRAFATLADSEPTATIDLDNATAVLEVDGPLEDDLEGLTNEIVTPHLPTAPWEEAAPIAPTGVNATLLAQWDAMRMTDVDRTTPADKSTCRPLGVVATRWSPPDPTAFGSAYILGGWGAYETRFYGHASAILPSNAEGAGPTDRELRVNVGPALNCSYELGPVSDEELDTVLSALRFLEE